MLGNVASQLKFDSFISRSLTWARFFFPSGTNVLPVSMCSHTGEKTSIQANFSPKMSMQQL